jgi:hypothetical protein
MPEFKGYSTWSPLAHESAGLPSTSQLMRIGHGLGPHVSGTLRISAVRLLSLSAHSYIVLASLGTHMNHPTHW